jgi:putative ABC transport system ATP-binding protein
VLRVLGVGHRHRRDGVPLRFPDFAAGAGEQVLLQGPSGSGKSTLLALLAGLLKLQAGSVHVGSADLARMGARETDAWRGRELGFVPQRLHLSAGLSVEHNLRLPYLAAGQPADAARIAQVMDRLGLQGLAARRPHELSVGQAQRVALARAVLRHPRVLLADEPTSNLDDASAAAALALLAEAARTESACLVIATHDARVAQALPGARGWLLAPAGARQEA